MNMQHDTSLPTIAIIIIIIILIVIIIACVYYFLSVLILCFYALDLFYFCCFAKQLNTPKSPRFNKCRDG